MASDLVLSLQIGAALSGSFNAVMGSTRNTLTRLGQTAEDLSRRQAQMGAAMATAMQHSGAELGRLSRQYQQLGTQIERVTAHQQRLNAAMSRQEQRNTARRELRGEAMETIGTGIAVMGPVVQATRAAIAFESSMADVRKVVDFKTPDGFAKLGQDLVQLSTRIPLAATELAQIAASGGQLGVAEKDLLGFTETVAKMATAFDMPAERAADAMSKLANVYKIPISQISQLGDAINQLSNESPAKASDIVDTLGRIGGTAKSFGLAQNQAASLSNAFISLGKTPEIAGTAINGMLTSMNLMGNGKADKKQTGALKTLGLSPVQLGKMIQQDGEKAILSLLEKVNKAPKGKQLGILVDLFGKEYADDVATLAGNLEIYRASIKTVTQKGKNGQPAYLGSMDKEFAARSATTENNLKLFKNQITRLGITMGDALLPPLNEALKALTPLIEQFHAFAKAHPGLIKGLVGLVGGLLVGKLAFIGLRYGVNLLLTPFDALRTLWAQVGARGVLLGQSVGRLRGWLARLPGGAVTVGQAFARLRGILGRVPGVLLRMGAALWRFGRSFLMLGRLLLTNPIGLIITGIAIAGYLIYRNWDKIAPVLKKVWAGLKAGYEWAKGKTTDLIEFFATLPGKLAEAGRHMIDGLINGIKERWAALKQTVGDLASSVMGWFRAPLGIHSPSRVFMGFGHNIAQGAALGIQRGQAQAVEAAASLADRVTGAASGMVGGRGQAVAGGITVHFQPQVTIQGNADKSVVEGAFALTVQELERLLSQVQARRERRGYEA